MTCFYILTLYQKLWLVCKVTREHISRQIKKKSDLKSHILVPGLPTSKVVRLADECSVSIHFSLLNRQPWQILRLHGRKNNVFKSLMHHVWLEDNKIPFVVNGFINEKEIVKCIQEVGPVIKSKTSFSLPNACHLTITNNIYKNIFQLSWLPRLCDFNRAHMPCLGLLLHLLINNSCKTFSLGMKLQS